MSQNIFYLRPTNCL